MHDLTHEFTSRKVSPWGGIKLFYETYVRSGMREQIAAMDFPWPGSNRGYDPVDKIEQFMVGVVLGARRFQHGEYLRADEVVREVFGWQKGMASPSTLSRFFQRFDLKSNRVLFGGLMQAWWARMPIKRMTIDVDSTVIQRYGRQMEGAERGFNPKRRGGRSHHPILAFCPEMGMVVNQWMRPGNAADAFEAPEFLAETIACAGGRERVGLVRADAGFYGDGLLRLLEGYTGDVRPDGPGGRVIREAEPSEPPVDYIVNARVTPALAAAVAAIEERAYHDCDEVWPGAHYAELDYRGQGWCEARRMVVVRTPRSEESAGRQAKLFAEDERLRCYDFRVLCTSSDVSCARVHAQYNARAKCENQIKELKYDYAADGFACKELAGTEAAFSLVMLAYNIMALFKQQVMKSTQQLRAIRFQCIAIGSYLVRSGRKTTLKLSAEGKRRHFLDHLFKNVRQVDVELLSP